jgi:Fe-S cluster assembly ATP-binding protein
MLKIQDLSAYTLKKEKILEKINISFSENSINLILGANATGKTTLAEILSGSKDILIKGKILFQGKDITRKTLDQRARLGIFLAYQNPIEIPGVKIFDFLYASYKAVSKKDLCVWDFHTLVLSNLSKLKLTEQFLERNINEGFSGGEKKKLEILQMLILKPKVVILDEIDSGLDIDSVKTIFKIIKQYQKDQKATVIIISHSPTILEYIAPEQVLLIQGKTIKEKGDIKLAKKILKKGYEENN